MVLVRVLALEKLAAVCGLLSGVHVINYSSTCLVNDTRPSLSCHSSQSTHNPDFTSTLLISLRWSSQLQLDVVASR